MTWYPATITVQPASEPLTVAQVQAQTRVDGDDTYLGALIASARSYVEVYLGTPLVSRTVTVKCDNFSDFKAFPVVPLGSISAISYIDGNGVTQTLDTAIYEVRSDGLTASIALKYNQQWPLAQIGSRITITAVVGYSSIPEAILHAMKLLVSQWYDNSTSLSAANRAAPEDSFIPELPHAVAALLSNYRVFSF